MTEGGAASTSSRSSAPPFVSIVGVDTTDFSYLACSRCERPLAGSAANSCPSCTRGAASPPPTRLYRLLVSIATAEEVIVAVCFDRSARVLMGCSAEELEQFCAARAGARERAAETLEGEICRMTLRAGKKGNSQHLRVASVMPLRVGFRPVIDRLRTWAEHDPEEEEEDADDNPWILL